MILTVIFVLLEISDILIYCIIKNRMTLMFDRAVYIQRRADLKNRFESDILLFLCNRETAANCPGNRYGFKQDSALLYYFGIGRPDIAAVVDMGG